MNETGYEKSKLSILGEILSFPTIHGKDWDTMNEPIVGDLVSLCSAPSTKWYLSWVVELKTENGWNKYLLKSIEDGSLCWWENVGINIYSRERVSERPNWKWSDKQYDFNAKWLRACKKHGAYIVLPLSATFDGDKVTLGTRIRYGFGDRPPVKTFDNWKKLLSRDMQQFYLDSVEISNNRKAS